MAPDLFFPSDLAGFSAAARICASCPVQQRCLEYALENRITEGVWGGASQRERIRIRRRRQAASAVARDQAEAKAHQRADCDALD